MSLFGRARQRKEPVVVSGLDKTDRHKAELHELKVRSGSDSNKTCIICVGAKGSGKSATISRFNVIQVDSSNNCILYKHSSSKGPEEDRLFVSWLEVSDWDHSIDETEDCFHDTLELLVANGITRIQSILWHIIPGTVLNNITLYEQARFINMFKPKEIWSNVVVVAKCSANPERDGKEAARTISEFTQDIINVPIIGYRLYDDPNLSAHERNQFEDAAERAKFNVKTREEVQALVEASVLGRGSPCNLDDDENEQTIPLHTEVKTVFGLPPIVFAKPF